MLNRHVSANDLLNNIALIKEFSIIENNPNGLTKELVQLLGKIYLNRYPAPQGFFAKFFSAHDNQALAITLTNCCLDTPYELWQLLAKTVEEVPKIGGKLAETITNLHRYAFQKEIYCSGILKRHDDPSCQIPKLYAAQLLGISSSFYAGQFSKELKCKPGLTPG